MYSECVFSQTATHSTLLARLADVGDFAAWVEFKGRYSELIRGFCVRRGLQAADIEDVEQEVLLSLSKAMGNFNYDPGKGLFRSYLKTVVNNAIARKWRQNPPAGGLSQAEGVGIDSDDDPWEQEWRQYHYRRAMRVIETEYAEADRRAFAMYAVEGRGAGEVAKELAMSVDAVYQAKSRILKRLSAIIEAQIADEG
ncbi:MAG: DNA-directed RNA polymerase sigma-70 factor [Phycisphaerae bacterium]|nr:MAG: DNA-directed RNA polymerase sigma-70 factor [Phycisphaerae bacterium]